MQGPTQPRRRPEKLSVTSLDAGTPQERKSMETGASEHGVGGGTPGRRGGA